MTGAACGSRLAAALDEVLALPGELGARERLARERERLAAGRLNVVVVGRFKRGKSTLLNALVGEPLLPMGVVPVTAIVTLLEPGPERAARVVLTDGRVERAETSRLAEWVSERENPENVRGVERVEVTLPGLDLGGDVVLADTPGSGSAFRHNTEALEAFLGHIDAGLFVVSADPPVGEGDLELLAEVAATAGEVLVALNKADRLEPAELEESLAYTREAVRRALGRELPVVACSARRALEGGDDPGVGEIRRWLRTLAGERAGTVLEAAVARRAGRALAQELALVEVERAAAERGAAQLEAALASLEAIRVELGERVRDAEAAFTAGCRRLMAGYDDAAREAAPGIAADLARRVERAALELERAGRRGISFQRRLEAARDAAALELLSPFQEARERAVIEGFERLAARALGAVNALVDDAFARAAALFGLEVERFDVAEGFRMESRLEYRVGLPRVNLDYLLDGALLLLPPRLGRRLYLRRMVRGLPEAVDRQLGLIRADLHERLNESAISFRGELGRRVAAALERLEAAVRRGLELVEAGGERLAARLGELERRREALERAVAACRDAAS